MIRKFKKKMQRKREKRKSQHAPQDEKRLVELLKGIGRHGTNDHDVLKRALNMIQLFPSLASKRISFNSKYDLSSTRPNEYPLILVAQLGGTFEQIETVYELHPKAIDHSESRLALLKELVSRCDREESWDFFNRVVQISPPCIKDSSLLDFAISANCPAETVHLLLDNLPLALTTLKVKVYSEHEARCAGWVLSWLTEAATNLTRLDLSFSKPTWRVEEHSKLLKSLKQTIIQCEGLEDIGLRFGESCDTNTFDSIIEVLSEAMNQREKSLNTVRLEREHWLERVCLTHNPTKVLLQKCRNQSAMPKALQVLLGV